MEEKTMKKQLLALAMAGAMLLGGCQPTYNAITLVTIWTAAIIPSTFTTSQCFHISQC